MYNHATFQRYGRDFPAISPADQARVHKLLLDSLGISKVHAVVGSSLGGMQVFKFAVLFPEMLDRAISIVATGKTTPGTVAFRRVQRAAIMADPEYKDGNYTGAGPVSGMKVARELGTITYRSRDEFNERFEWNAFPPYSPQHLCYEVETYLAHQVRLSYLS
jgi:homoserine O-acetyltransferase